MPHLSTVLVFAAASVALIVIPGPNVLYIVARGIGEGRRSAVASAFGVNTAAVVFVAATALGLTALLASSGAAFHTVRYAGAAYLVYLGLRTLFGRGNVELAAIADADAGRTRRAYAQGLLIGLTNPKVALFFLAFFPQFVDPDRAAVTQVFVLGALFVAIGLVLDLTWAASSGTIGQVLQRRPAFLRKQRYLTGGVYLALGLASVIGGGGRRSSA